MAEIVKVMAPVHIYGRDAKGLVFVPDSGISRDLGVVKPNGSFYPSDLKLTFEQLKVEGAVPTADAVALIEIAKTPIESLMEF